MIGAKHRRYVYTDDNPRELPCDSFHVIRSHDSMLQQAEESEKLENNELLTELEADAAMKRDGVISLNAT